METVTPVIFFILGAVLAGALSWIVRGTRSKSDQMVAQAEQREKTIRLESQLAERESAGQIVEIATAKMTETFQAAAGTALHKNSETFMASAQESLGKALETAKGDFKQRHEQFEALVKPLAENYTKLNPQIDSLMKQGQVLAQETGKLSNALNNNRQIGSWGEIQLRRIIEMAGMVEHCDFTEQTTAQGSQDRPDLTIRLPEQRTIIVDSKASTGPYMEAQAQEDPLKTDEILKRHAQGLRTQVDNLAAKSYGEKVEGSLNFVVMFVPADQFLSAALSSNPGLIEYAMAKRVAIATPSTLISLLWAVANGWQRYRIAENAEAIREVGEEMHRRMETFVKYYQDVGKKLETTVTAFNASISSYDARVWPQGQRFTSLLTKNEESLAPPALIEKAASESRHVLETPEINGKLPEEQKVRLLSDEG